jgi:2-isopropylmalate synthase
VSDLAGRTSIAVKARELGFELDEQAPEMKAILEELKQLEFEGHEFEAADASLKLLLAKWLKRHSPAFEFEGFRVIIERRSPESSVVAEATVKVKVKGKSMHTVAECVGPVGALDKALRLALDKAYPVIKDTTLSDYKVRILDSKRGTNSRARVLIETTDGQEIWGTVGVSDNIIEASWEALRDAVEYKLLLEEEKAGIGINNCGYRMESGCSIRYPVPQIRFQSIGASSRLRSSAMLPSRRRRDDFAAVSGLQWTMSSCAQARMARTSGSE